MESLRVELLAMPLSYQASLVLKPEVRKGDAEIRELQPPLTLTNKVLVLTCSGNIDLEFTPCAEFENRISLSRHIFKIVYFLKINN